MNKVKLLDWLNEVKELVEEELKIGYNTGILSLGICDALYEMSEGDFNHKNRECLIEYFESWIPYSGCREYPVPDPYTVGAYAGNIFFEIENMWEGEYGKLRMWLLNHIIEQVRQEIYKGL